MNVFFSKNFEKKLEKIINKNTLLKRDFNKQLKIFSINPKHKSLKLHKLKGARTNQYSIWIKADIRAIFIIDKSGAVFTTIVSHDEY